MLRESLAKLMLPILQNNANRIRARPSEALCKRFYYRSPGRPRRDLYEYEDVEVEDVSRDGSEKGYKRNFSDWFQRYRRTIYRAGIVGGAATGYYLYNLEEAPITHRRRFMSVSKGQEQIIAEASLQDILSQYQSALLPSHHTLVKYVERVASRIIATLEQQFPEQSNTKWRVFVINSPIANAFVLPGGEIFVFKGMLPVASDEAGLAAIIGHEVAHKLARHSAEKMSFYQFFNLAALIGRFIITGEFGASPLTGIMRDLFLFLPFSRKCETEADYIGLLLMAKACYDPSEAVGLWQRMQIHTETDTRGSPQPPSFLSTHPSHKDRIEKIKTWLPEATIAFENSGCLDAARFWSFK